jgi:hypothetical protein
MRNRDLRRQLDTLEFQALHSTAAATVASALNQAGDACERAGEVALALEYYGQAIDANVKADRFTPAMALCRKVMRVAPNVVRARCTLAWLAIGNGFERDAITLLGEYVSAAQRARCGALAVAQLRRMSEVATGAELRLALEAHLRALGDDATADRLAAESLAACADTSQNGDASVSNARWTTARRGALLGPRDLAA